MYDAIKRKELKPKYVNQKSFYRKAYITEYFRYCKVTNKSYLVKTELTSYETIVITIHWYQDSTIKLEYTNLYSRTTTRHIQDFISQILLPISGINVGNMFEINGRFYNLHTKKFVERGLLKV